MILNVITVAMAIVAGFCACLALYFAYSASQYNKLAHLIREGRRTEIRDSKALAWRHAKIRADIAAENRDSLRDTDAYGNRR